MSINEIIKKYLPVENQKLLYANKQYNYCSAYSYQNCSNCKEIKPVKCCKKLVYQSAKQISEQRWHVYFLCGDSHLVIRWVLIDDSSISVGKIKN
ncbi:hypothetical protein [Spiroplasma platyhelix]|uniref:Uncharacterized protein n=1 Tax=Spiroplasma platyhelix PALS-1 TaxID=1276218 RepID=A0A846TXI7_9MOLU|nr:hypothetical protein [Spiroplasma platyhelix]MBE4704421.1 hypothetical protein [Spiroplasma platyhelix PALS-1]NKE38791.1 hypothetical protein [Spiroplasma platyhelix PALS-1]UJB29003.1 hypothetical protein SPLAT_v1c02390 [Spiroplasma platyhelix PALS-1]